MSSQGIRIDWSILGTWAQAIATPIAVFLAAGLAERQARKERKDSAKERLRSISAIFKEALRIVLQAYQVTHPTGLAIYADPPDDVAFADVLAALERVPLLEIGGWRAVQATFVVARSVRRVRAVAARWRDSEKPDNVDKYWLETSRRDIESEVREIETLIGA
ncbi:MAG TPA: hypothetical protein VMT68_14995 [Caulobacteraceae bacterium]|nr:hypothetical protein [Caulobacteraceae bacterium]